MSGLEIVALAPLVAAGAAIPALVCNIIQTITAIKKLRLDRKIQSAKEQSGKDIVQSGRQEVCNTFNNCVVILGRQFENGDGT